MIRNEISQEAARRFLLKRQGLVGRPAWTGKTGAEAALNQIGYVQVDSITVVARSHDLTLWSRVEGYRPEHLSDLLWQDRSAMEGTMPLCVVPAADLPHALARFRKPSDRIERQLNEHAGVVAEVMARIRQEGAVSARDFQGRTRVPGGWSTQKDAVKALELLWHAGVLVTSHRTPDFTRYYDLPERVFPGYTVALFDEAARFWARKSLRVLGLAKVSHWVSRLKFSWRATGAEVRSLIDEVIESGEAIPVQVEGSKAPYYVPAEWAAELAAGEPAEERLTFLAPLDNLIWDRGRLLELFQFDYRWEVYIPAAQRKWGYYVLPILYGTRLVGRLDPKMDRKAGKLLLQGFWLEAPELERDLAFQVALIHRLTDFARFHGAGAVEATFKADRWLKGLIKQVNKGLKS